MFVIIYVSEPSFCSYIKDIKPAVDFVYISYPLLLVQIAGVVLYLSIIIFHFFSGLFVLQPSTEPSQLSLYQLYIPKFLFQSTNLLTLIF